METDFFDIVTGVLREDTLAPYLFIIRLDNVLRTMIDLMKENDFTLEKARSRRYIAQKSTDAAYAGDRALLANTPGKAESLLHSLEKAAGSIKYMYLNQNQTSDISSLICDSLKLVDKFTYLGSIISSTENDIVKPSSAIDRLSVTWMSYLSDKIKCNFFQAAFVSVLLYRCTTWALTKCIENKRDSNCTRMLRAILNKSRKQHSAKQQLYGHLPPISKKTQIRRTSKRKKGELISEVPHGPLHTDEQVLDVSLKLIDNSSVQTRGVVLRTCRIWWTTEINGEGESEKSGKSMLAAQHGDDVI